MAKRKVLVGRVYDDRDAEQAARRVLVDRLWPRGLSKERAALDEWCKQVAPSNELRTWYGHAPDRFDEFRRRYHAELAEGEPAAALAHLRSLPRDRPLLLLTATKDLTLSHLTVLTDLLTATKGPAQPPDRPAT